MEVSGTQNSFLYTTATPGGKKTIVSEAQDTLNNGGQPRTGTNDLVFQSLKIIGRQAPPIEAAGPLAGFRNESKCSTVGNPPDVTRRAYLFFPPKKFSNIPN